ncbi:MAG: DNA translocase FtsK 4TM domain-containing protein, partial [Methylobacter sp.]
MEEKTFRGLREVALLGFIAGALFFLISLITFSNEDAGWTHSGSVQTVSNACGVFGAWIADFMLSCFGLVAYLFPVIIFWQGYLIYTRGKQGREKMVVALQWIGSIATIISGAALLNLYLLRIGIELPSNTGGILGQETGNALLVVFGNSGATLFLLVILLAGVTLVTGLSWVALIDVIGKYTVFICRVFCNSVLGLLQEHSANRTQMNRPQTLVNNQGRPELKKKISAKVIPTIEKPIEKITKNTLPPKKQPTVKYDASKGVLPSLELLDHRDTRVIGYSQTDLEEMSRLVEDILADFNVVVSVVGFHPGPVITRFEIQPAAGVKVSRISTLSKDLARALSVTSVRIVEIIPGKSVVGLEIPNREREMVTLRELLVSAPFEKSKSMLTLAMGKDISGTPMVADLGKMPHALVAGTTGSGKSVAINTMILSLLYKATPEQVRLIMIDPKMLELSVYEGIPHLLTPVVTDMKEASNALRWAVAEMERRYKLMSKMGVRNLAGFNQLIEDATARGETIRDPMFQMIN